MNLGELHIPALATEMIKVCEEYYRDFYLEMIRMSNASFAHYISEYLALLKRLAKDPGSPNVIRAAIGVVSMEKFGYHDFRDLARIIDLLVPQRDAEYAKFTSWCIGRVVNHPDLEKGRFVAHLFHRIVDWTRCPGNRARPIAAAWLLHSLAEHAGSNIVSFYDRLEMGVWALVSQPSLQVQKATARAMESYTNAVIRYRRGDLADYMDQYGRICGKLLCFGDAMREYAALSLMEVLINKCPSHFVFDCIELFTTVATASIGQPMLVVSQSYVVLSCLSQVDPRTFMRMFAEDHFEETDKVLFEFPVEITGAIVMMCKTIPQFMKTKITELHTFANGLLDEEPCCAYRLLAGAIKAFREKAVPEEEFIDRLVARGELSSDFTEFVVALTACQGVNRQRVSNALCLRIEKELNSGDKVHALQLLASLPLHSIAWHAKLLTAVNPLSNDPSVEIRIEVPKALYKLCHDTNMLTIEDLNTHLLQLAIFEQAVPVRLAIMETLCDNANESLAGEEFVEYFQILVNDDSTTTKTVVFKLLAKLAVYDPMRIAGITRNCLLNSFFVLRHVSSTRRRNRIVRFLPGLLRASAAIVSAYSEGLMDIVMDCLTTYNPKRKFENFLEEDAQTSIMIGMMETIIILAPLEVKQVSKHGDVIVNIVCDIVVTTEHRLLALWIFKLLFKLLSAPGSDIRYRTKVPMILSVCSTYLAHTCSRKARMAILKVVGAIGCLEVHQSSVQMGSRTPINMDDDLARRFFKPNRDANGLIDESLLLSKSGCPQFFFAYSARSLLAVFKRDDKKELYEETIYALVEILQSPRMHMLGEFDEFVSRFLDVMSRASDDDLTTMLPYGTQLVAGSTHNTSPFVKRWLELVRQRYNVTMAVPILDLIIAFISSLRDGFGPFSADTICLLVGILDDMKTTSVEISNKVLKAFSLISVYATNLAYLIVPQICDAVLCEQTLLQVRVSSLNTLRKMAQIVDLYQYMAPVVRSIHFAMRSRDPVTIETAFELLYALLKSQGRKFLIKAGRLLQDLKETGRERPELIALVDEIELGKLGDTFQPLDLTKARPPPPTDKAATAHSFSEDAIVGRLKSSHLGPKLEQWLRSFILALIANSPAAPIRACINLATSYYQLGRKMFNVAFFSCWQALSDDGKERICEGLRGVLRSRENFETVAREILNLLVFMDRIEQPLEIPAEELVRVAIRYGCGAYALRLLHGSSNMKPDIPVLIDVLVQLGDWPSAICVWNSASRDMSSSVKLNKLEILSKLQLWDQAEPLYREGFEKFQDFESFRGLTESYAALGKWEQITDGTRHFKRLPLNQKRVIAPYFAKAALYHGKWDDVREALKYTPDDSELWGILSALDAIHSGRYEAIDKIIDRAFSVLASRPIKFWADNQQIRGDTMVACQQLVEAGEMKDWAQRKNRKEVEQVWRQRLLSAPREFGLWFTLIANRVVTTGVSDVYLAKFFELKSSTLGSKVHEHAFKVLFPNFTFETGTDVQKLCYVEMQWNIGNKDVAMRQALNLTETATGACLQRAQLFYSTWILEHDQSYTSLKTAYRHLKNASQNVSPESVYLYGERKREKARGLSGELVLAAQVYREVIMDTYQLHVLRKWSRVNVQLAHFDQERRVEYVINSIEALSRCTSMRPSFPDVVQLLNLFFENACYQPVFDATSEYIRKIKLRLLLQAAPQIFVELGSQDIQLRNFLQNLVFDMLEVHFHDMYFSLLVLRHSKNIARSQITRAILLRLDAKRPEIGHEVKLIRTTLLRAAVTWNEEVMQRITDAFDHYQRRNVNSMLMSINSILEMVKSPKCEMQRQFVNEHERDLRNLEHIIDNFTLTDKTCLNELSQWCKAMQNKITEELKHTRTIELAAVSPEVCEKNSFVLAVPGTYRPGKPIIHIEYFVGQFSVYMTKQQPKDIIIKGEDGNFYQYLLKGHEDLRLDERIMQFFRLINSIMRKDTSFNSIFIQTVSVIPLSMSHGLVQWATGTDTLRAVVEQYRTFHNRNPLREYHLLEEYGTSNFDYLEPIQKLQIIKQIFSEVPDTDIANFFWMKADSSESWWKQTTVFSTSTAVMSVVGYIIGLGDRHPSNLLIDRFTGRVVHIDFGDCFERASLRKFLPEVVPFRLTRMMVRALGPGGVGGLFRSMAIDVLELLRKKRTVLEMVLSIFVHEPVVNADSSDSLNDTSSDVESKNNEALIGVGTSNVPILSRAPTGSIVNSGRVYMTDSDFGGLSIVEARNRITHKLTGFDYSTGASLSVEEQASWLIDTATNEYALARMYSGWCPFW